MEKEENKKENGILFEQDGLSNTRPSSHFNRFNDTLVGKDYLKFRFLNFRGLDDDFIIELLKKLYVSLDFVTNEKGKSMFKVFYTFDEDIFVYGGRESERDEFGNDTYFFEMKGHALRMFELRCRNNNVDIQKAYLDVFLLIYKNVTIRKIKWKKIDVFLDCFTNYILKEEYDGKFEKGYFTSPLKVKEKQDEFVFCTNIKTKKGWSWRIGGRGGTHIMLYDKMLERIKKKEKVPYEYWLRIEARFRDEKADIVFFELLNAYMGNRTLRDTISSLIYELLQIKEDNNYDKTHMYMAKEWNKWIELLGNPTKTDEKDIESIEIKCDIKLLDDMKMRKTMSWVDDITSLAFTQCYLANMDNFDYFVANLLKKGSYKLKSKDLSKVNYYRVAEGKKPLKMEEAKKHIDDKIRFLNNNSGFLYENAIHFFGDKIDVIYN